MPPTRWLPGTGWACVVMQGLLDLRLDRRRQRRSVLDALPGRTRAGGRATVTPAFPDRAHRLSGAISSSDVAAVPLKALLRHHPLNPMLDANLTPGFWRQARSAGGDSSISRPWRGVKRCARGWSSCPPGAGAAIADAVFDADLEPLGAAALERRLSLGASGSGARSLARALIATGAVQRHHDAPRWRPTRWAGRRPASPTLTRRRRSKQIACAEQGMPVHRRLSRAAADDGPESPRALARANRRMNTEPF